VVALLFLLPIRIERGRKVMEAGSTTVWHNGRFMEPERHDEAMKSLCQAIEKVVKQHHDDTGVRAVILMFEQPAKKDAAPEPAHAPVPVYVDVFDSGFSQDPGYGHGI
jgi:hypothetical protein